MAMLATPLGEKSVNVAFDIPLDKKRDVTKTPKPPIAEKLESWKPPSPTKEDIQAKVAKAQQRRSENITNAVVKSASHNEVVQKTLHKKKAQDADGVAQLDGKIQQKMSDAKVKRTKLTTRIVNKLSRLNQAKHDRGAKALERGALDSQELAVKVEEKLSVAADRKEQMESKKTDQIAASNQMKMMRVAETKIKDKAAAAEKSLALDDKLTSARGRKDMMISETVETLSQTNSDKAVRVRELRRSHEFKVKHLDAKSQNKIVAADRRKAKQKDESLSVQDRLDRAEAMRVGRDEALAEMEHALMSRLEKAEQNRARLIAETVNDSSRLNKAKLDKANELRKNSEMATLKLRDSLEEKLSRAEEIRIEQLVEKAEKALNLSRSFDESRESFSASSPSKEDIDAKLGEAAARREALLLQRSEQAGFKARSVRTSTINFKPTYETSADPTQAQLVELIEPNNDNAQVNTNTIFNPIVFLWSLLAMPFRPILSAFGKK